MTIRAGFFSTTVRHDLSSEPDGLTVQGANESRHAFLIQSDRVIHITRDGSDASEDNGLRIPANTLVLINTVAGDEIRFVQGTGEDDGGSVWFSEVDH